METNSAGASASARSRPLRALLFVQTINTFVNGAWTFAVALLLKNRLPAGAGQDAIQLVNTLAFLSGTLPLIPFSLPAASLCDRLRKDRLLVRMSFGLTLLMGVAALLLASDLGSGAGSRPLLLATLVLVGVQAAFFSPAKYGLVPELVAHDRLAASNGLLELCNFIAIVGGPALAGPLLTLAGPRPWLVPAALAVLALVAAVASRAIPAGATPSAKAPSGGAIGAAWGAMRRDRVLALAVVGSVGFWGAAKLLGQNLLVDGADRLHLGDLLAGAPLAVLLIGVGVGSALAGKLSARKVEVGLIPLGTFVLGGFTLLLALLAPERTGTFVLLPLLGIGGGLLNVPLYSLLQWRAPSDRRGAVLALANVFIFAAICAGSGSAALLARFGLSTRAIFGVAGGAVVIGGLVATALAPQSFLRLILLLLTHTIYKLKIRGREHVPETGGALLVPNHVSFVDGLFLIASLDRPIRFLVDASFFGKGIVGRVLRWVDAIPIAATGGPRVILRALRDAGDAIEAGHLVCIFAEGQITRTGAMNTFRRGLERIMKGRTAPIIPVHLDGVWGSIFSFAGGRFVTKKPEKLRYPVTVSFGAPMVPTTPIHAVRRAVQELGESAWLERRATRPPLHVGFLRLARRRPGRLLFAESSGAELSRMDAAIGAIALARALRGTLGDDERVGVLLPPCSGAALANLALAFGGRTSVNLNFTAGAAALGSAARQAGLRHVITSAEFLAKAKIELPEGMRAIELSQVVASIQRRGGGRARLIAWLLARFAPARSVERSCGARRAVTPDDLVTILFSSGSTGEPKGVMLSHFNIDSNIQGLAQAVRTTSDDRILGILPLFHSFGFTATLWFPACAGLATIFHPSPIDAAAVGELVERHRVTFLLATPTLLAIYLRRVPPQQFGSLRLVLTGAEKLNERVADLFEQRFGIRPLEGYGATECSPVVAASSPDFRAPGFYQPGFRRGFVGQPIPGVTVRVVDPESFAVLEPLTSLPPNVQGLLLVRGPNVMQGYLGRPDLTAKVLRDGWYVTGDLARVDEDGFLQITDRVSRFSKIGGEMVPHGRVEEELHTAANATPPAFSVTALPDEKKGERLVVLHTLPAAGIDEWLAKLTAAGLPNLFLPRRDHFLQVAAIPLLGTGKVDLRTVKAIALERLGSADSAGSGTTR